MTRARAQGPLITRRTLLRSAVVGAGALGMWQAGLRPVAAQVPELYEPTWESLDQHPLPQWFQDAKFGIFIHWGVFSVPAWGPRGSYAEWYPVYMRQPNHPTYAYHRATYGADFAYRDFIPMWRAEHWDPDAWAELFHRAGARYVVLVGEHHDGFPLWDSQYNRWNSVQMGPRRDFVSELAEATRRLGMKYSASYHAFLSNYSPEHDGPHPWYQSASTRPQYMEMTNAKLRELIELCDPDILWLDGDWNFSYTVYGTLPTLAWYYNRAAARGQEVAANDRLGRVRGEHGDFYTQEYDYDSDQGVAHYWENTRGMAGSFGFNQNEPPEDYLTLPELVELLVDTVSRRGNLLLNVGPRADGTINDIQTDLLEGLGRWLDINGEAIYGTTIHTVQEGQTAEGLEVRYTATSTPRDHVYAILLGRPGDVVTLPAADLPPLRPSDRVDLLGAPPRLRWHRDGDRIVVTIPRGVRLPDQPAHTLRFTRHGIPDGWRTQR